MYYILLSLNLERLNMRSPDFENKRDKTAPSAWPYAAEISSGFWSSETVLESPHYLLLSPQSSRKVQAFLKKFYREDVTEIGAPFPRFGAMRRYPQLEKMIVEAEGRKMTGAQVAEHNRREITKAGMIRWSQALRELFGSSGLREIRQHKNGPLVVATVGGEEGYGIREVAQGFAQMQIPIALYAVDPRSLPGMEEYKDLFAQKNFSLSLNLRDPRKIHWAQIQPDVVVFPQLWIADFVAFDAWKETIAKIVEAKPSVVIAGFPRVCTVIEDPIVLEDVITMTAELMYKRQLISSPEVRLSTIGREMPETSVLGGLLSYYGYRKKAIKAYVDDLMVPYNLYGAAIEDEQGRSVYLAPFDPYFLLTVHEDLLPYA
jgi:hypothetical protein